MTEGEEKAKIEPPEVLFDDSPGQRLVGVAKLAAAGDRLGLKRRVEYRELPTRRYITRCRSDRVPFDWTINPYRGCEFGCKYCYARYTHEFLELRDPLDFETKIFAKVWNRARFREELWKVPRPAWIAIGTATDPYQPAERRYGITRGMLEVLAEEGGRKLSLTTKSNLVVRDLGLLTRIARANRLQVALSITTPEAELARLMEPYAPRPNLRLNAVRTLSEAGIQVSVLACPLLPGLNDSAAMLDELARQAGEAGASSFAGGVVFLKPCTHAPMFSFLERSFPHLLGRYRERFGKRFFLAGSYPEVIAHRLERARLRYGLAKRFAEYQPAEWVEPQMELPFGMPAAREDSLSKSTCRKYAASL